MPQSANQPNLGISLKILCNLIVSQSLKTPSVL
jgi:hypothetical protein